MNRKPVMFIGLNPSVADEEVNDNTIRVCINYAKRWGAGGIIMANLFAVIETSPSKMMKIPEPIGPENDEYLRQGGEEASMIIAAWGHRGSFMNRDQDILLMFNGRLKALALTKYGYPDHPTRLLSDLVPFDYY